jgi:hypothetical protein
MSINLVQDPGPDKLYYLCGPMTNLPEHNFPAFYEAASRLRHNGFKVVNPAELNPERPHRALAFKRDFKELLKCTSIILLPGFPYSNGAMKEIMVAAEFGYDVYLYTPGGLICLS